MLQADPGAVLPTVAPKCPFGGRGGRDSARCWSWILCTMWQPGRRETQVGHAAAARLAFGGRGHLSGEGPGAWWGRRRHLPVPPDDFPGGFAPQKAESMLGQLCPCQLQTRQTPLLIQEGPWPLGVLVLTRHSWPLWLPSLGSSMVGSSLCWGRWPPAPCLQLSGSSQLYPYSWRVGSFWQHMLHGVPGQQQWSAGEEALSRVTL